MHPRITVHDRVFHDQSLDDVLAGFARAGAERIGIGRGKLAGDATAAARIVDAGLT